MRQPTTTVVSSAWRDQGTTEGKRIIPEETAIAFTYDGGSYAVMMATPQNLEDFALGFSLTEGVVSSPSDIRQLDIVEEDAGIELRMWLVEPRATDEPERIAGLQRGAEAEAAAAARDSAWRAAAISRGSDRLRAVRHRKPR